MSSEHKKLKDLKSLSKTVAADLKALKSEGKTLPDILYNYRLQDGHLLSKRPRRGSMSGEEAARLEKEGRESLKTKESADAGINEGNPATVPAPAATAPTAPAIVTSTAHVTISSIKSPRTTAIKKPEPYEGT